MIANYRGAEIYFETTGNGTPVVLLHGFLETRKIWTPLIEIIAEKHQVINIDLLGHGKTGCTGYIHTMEEMAEAVHAVFSELKITSKARVIGHSMGGYVSLAFLEKHPQLVKQIILMNSTPEADSEERKENRDRAIALVKKNPSTFISMALANLFSSENREKYNSEFEKLKKEALTNSVQGIIAAAEGMKIRTDRTKVLKTFNGSKIIIAGEQDPILDHNILKIISMQCSCGFHLLSGGHMSYIENLAEIKSLCSSSII
ncbi:MAG TPA: alpha/beta hydrolase [Salinimicrobium sp.]|nr:alpha/beta hydrolase [Salinimicrobium sp.]